jgi:putative hemolysin
LTFTGLIYTGYAGFILEILGNFPRQGQKINFEKIRFTIETVDKKRIKQIKVTIE